MKPGNIVGAIANEAGLESQFIGRLSIRDHYSLIDLPDGMPAEVFEHLKKVWVVQQQLRIHEWDGNDTDAGNAPPAHKPGGFKKPSSFKPGGFPGQAGSSRGTVVANRRTSNPQASCLDCPIVSIGQQHVSSAHC